MQAASVLEILFDGPLKTREIRDGVVAVIEWKKQARRFRIPGE
jgi:hypothetical protein